MNLLTIEPGVCVRVGEGHTIEVIRITAIGTIDLPIVFTAIDSLARWSGTDFQDQGAGSPSSWYRRFEHAGGSAFGWTTAVPEFATVTHIHNYADPTGGAINASIHNGNLTLTNCVFRSNTASRTGGGLYVETGVADALELDGCTINENRTNPGEWRYVSTVGGCGLAIAGNCSMRDSDVTNNLAFGYAFEGSHERTRTAVGSTRLAAC